MELENIKQAKIEHVEKYYEHIEKLAHGLQTTNTNFHLQLEKGTFVVDYYLKLFI
jgi:hypothetical protein